MSKKSFKELGEKAVNKFFSSPIKDAQLTPAEPDAPITLVTPTTQSNKTASTEETKSSKIMVEKKTRVQARPRINMAFEESLLDYLHIMSRLDGVSITQYVNQLITKDKETNQDAYLQALKFFKK